MNGMQVEGRHWKLASHHPYANLGRETPPRFNLAAYLRMFRLFEADYPDRGATYWPVGPDGNQLGAHQDVLDAVQDMLLDVQTADINELNQFLYQDRSRHFVTHTAEIGQRRDGIVNRILRRTVNCQFFVSNSQYADAAINQ